MTDKQELLPTKEHIVRELINELRDVAVEYHSYGCLRELLATRVKLAIKEQQEWDTRHQPEPTIFLTSGKRSEPTEEMIEIVTVNDELLESIEAELNTGFEYWCSGELSPRQVIEAILTVALNIKQGE